MTNTPSRAIDFPMKTLRRNGSTLFILQKGDRLIETLTPELARLEIRGATISGLGALKDVELGYYELDHKEYIRKTFSEDYELISLSGNVALKDGQPFIHVHAALGDSRFQVFGGHLFEATVAVTAEISVLPFDFAPAREMDPAIGLGLICKMG